MWKGRVAEMRLLDYNAGDQFSTSLFGCNVFWNESVRWCRLKELKRSPYSHDNMPLRAGWRETPKTDAYFSFHPHVICENIFYEASRGFPLGGLVAAGLPLCQIPGISECQSMREIKTGSTAPFPTYWVFLFYRDFSVGIATGWNAEVRYLVGARDIFSFPQCPQTGPSAHSVYYRMGTWDRSKAAEAWS